jgi:hypothetical protein
MYAPVRVPTLVSVLLPPHVPGQRKGTGEAPPSPAYVSDFLATSDGLALTRAFTRLTNAKLRRRIVDLVKEIAGDGDR